MAVTTQGVCQLLVEQNGGPQGIRDPGAAQALREIAAVARLALEFEAKRQRTTISVESKTAAATGEPSVELRWGDEVGQLSVSEARVHALGILEAAEAAESDSLLFHLGQQFGNGPQAQAAAGAQLVQMLRSARVARREREGGR